MPVEGLKELEELIDRVKSVEDYIRSLQNTTHDPSRILLGGPVLWETEEQAIFERDNKEVSDAMRAVHQEVSRRLKGA